MRRRLLLAGLAALLVLAVVVAVPLLLEPVDRGGPGSGNDPLDDVVVVEDLPATHTSEDVGYEHRPPLGGPHADRWLACGVYDRPVREENAVHSLEHGTVWVTHGPDLTPDLVAALTAVLPDEHIVSPHPSVEAPLVVTVWGRQLALDGIDDPRLAPFLEEYGDGGTAPEPMASCRGGVRRFEEETVDV